MALDVLQRKNGSWFFKVRSPKLIAITVKPGDIKDETIYI